MGFLDVLTGGLGGIGGGQAAGSIGSTAKQSESTQTTNTNASTGASTSSGSDNQQLSGFTLVGDHPSLTLTDQGSLRAAFAIVSQAFKSIDTASHALDDSYDKALSAASSAFQSATAAQAQAYTPGGTFDTQKVILAFLGAGAIIAGLYFLKK